MTPAQGYQLANKKINEARKFGTTIIDLSHLSLNEIPEALWKLTNLVELKLSQNDIRDLPSGIGKLINLEHLNLDHNELTSLPDSIGQLQKLKTLLLSNNRIFHINNLRGKLKTLKILSLSYNYALQSPNPFPHWENLSILNLTGCNLRSLSSSISLLSNVSELWLSDNFLTDLPGSLATLANLRLLELKENPLTPELSIAYSLGIDNVKNYLRAKEKGGEIVLNEAKLILVGEGGVGKTSLLASLSGKKWEQDRETTHGMEVDIRSFKLRNPKNKSNIILNGWDFGGQNIYRHTHQLFFTAPAVYLAVWEPRRGPEQCRVEDWIKMVKQRAFDESNPEERPRILIVATHGGPKERLAHIDEQAIKDEFGILISGFYHVDSKPDKSGECFQLDYLKDAIGKEAACIPSVGRSVPANWKKVLDAVRNKNLEYPYISYRKFEDICEDQEVSRKLASTYISILNELGHLIYYPNDDELQNIVILNPEYLSKAIGFVLEDTKTKESYGLIEHNRLGEIWDNPNKDERDRYPRSLFPVFLRLMDRFDLSYKVNRPNGPDTSLMAQLVPNQRPENWEKDWSIIDGDYEKTQICRVLDATTGRTEKAEGLMYRLIVRLHRYSLGKNDYQASRHWKKGMILEDGYNGRGFIEEIDGDLYVTVRAAYPELFLHQLCNEIQWLVENFWKGLDARIYMPCKTPECKGKLEFEEIVENKREGMNKIRCSVCKKYHEVDELMSSRQVKPSLEEVLSQLIQMQEQILLGQRNGFAAIDANLKVNMSRVDEQYQALMTILTDEATEGPRLFSFEPVDNKRWNPKRIINQKFKLVLWCEHSKKPLTAYEEDQGTYEIEIPKEWMQKAAPLIRIVSKTLSLALPIVAPGVKLGMDDPGYKGIGEQLEFAVKASDSLLKGGKEIEDWLTSDDPTSVNETQEVIRAQGSLLRELHSMLKLVDPNNSYGGLVRVQNKKREFLWVHEQFVQEY